MRFLRPKGLLAGFYASDIDPGGILLEIGEQWTPATWKIDPHRNKGWELYYQARGSSTWRQERKQFQVPTGGYYLMAPGTRHKLESFQGEETHFYFAVFHPEAVLPPSDQHLLAAWKAPFQMGTNAQALEGPFRSLVREVSLEGDTRGTGLRLHLAVLCLEIYRLLHFAPTPSRDFAAHSASLRARECMEGRPGHPWRLDELAALGGISVPHLVEVFRRDFGASPARHLREIRLARAKDLLRTGNRSVTQIAFELGFSSSQHFANSFRQRFGLTPREASIKGKPGRDFS